MIDARLRSGTWKIVPDRPDGFAERDDFCNGGLFGRIARAAHTMMSGFGGKRIAYDPFVPADVMEKEGVTKVQIDELFHAGGYSLAASSAERRN